MFEGFQRLQGYVMAEELKILGFLERLQCFKCFECFKVSMLLLDSKSALNLQLFYNLRFEGFREIRVFKSFIRFQGYALL